MAGNTFGQLFRLTTFGESHGTAIGGVVDGCPAGLELDLEAIQYQLDRRKPGQSKIVTQRKESDTVHFLSGIFENKTTGAPIGFTIPNEAQRSKDYDHLKDTFRPSHADYTWETKYGHRDYRGGGRTSARETASRVAGGAIAQQLLALQGVKIWSYVSAVGELECPKNWTELAAEQVDDNIVRCPDAATAEAMIDLISKTRKAGDTIGGVITCVIENVPVGWGEPAFDKLHADLGKAMLSINAVKGFEYGSGFAGSQMNGSVHNDIFTAEGSETSTKTNHSGGIQGGISNGQPIYFRVAFKPVATIMRDQETVNKAGETVTVEGKGRHDPCVVPRAVPIVDAMAALVLADHYLRQQTTTI